MFPGLPTASGRTFAWRGTGFGDTPLNAEVKLEVWDSPNSAGVVIDALRCAKLGLDRGSRVRSMRPAPIS